MKYDYRQVNLKYIMYYLRVNLENIINLFRHILNYAKRYDRDFSK